MEKYKAEIERIKTKSDGLVRSGRSVTTTAVEPLSGHCPPARQAPGEKKRTKAREDEREVDWM